MSTVRGWKECANHSLSDAIVGSVVSLSLGILGDPLIIINKFDIAKDLMSGRSANSADRPFPITAEVYVLTDRAYAEPL